MKKRIIGALANWKKRLFPWLRWRRKITPDLTNELARLRAELQQARVDVTSLSEQLQSTRLELEAMEQRNRSLSDVLAEVRKQLAHSEAHQQALVRDFLQKIEHWTLTIQEIQKMLGGIIDHTFLTLEPRDSFEREEMRPEVILENLAEAFYWVELNLQALQLCEPAQESDWYLLADTVKDTGQRLEQQVEWLKWQIEHGLQAESTLQETRQIVQQVLQQLANAREQLEHMRNNLSECL